MGLKLTFGRESGLINIFGLIETTRSLDRVLRDALVSGGAGGGNDRHMVLVGSVFGVQREIWTDIVAPSGRDLVVVLYLRMTQVIVYGGRVHLGAKRDGVVTRLETRGWRRGMEETIELKGTCQVVVFSLEGGTEILEPVTSWRTSASLRAPRYCQLATAVMSIQ